MPIFQFIYDSSCEQRRRKNTKSNVIINAESYNEAQMLVDNHIRKRLNFTGFIDQYNIILEWVN